MVRTIRELSFQGKRVLMRAEFNVPMKDGQILDDRRARAAIPTIQAILADGATQLVLIAHLGRPKGERKPEFSLRPIAHLLQELLGEKIAFVDDCLGDIPGDRIVLLENLRYHAEEKENNEEFAAQLATKGDIYVNDAFGAMHRAHASMDALPRKFTEKGIGFLAERELKNLDFTNAQSPFIAVLGAAKISDKITLLEAMLNRVDTILLGGAIVFNFLKAKGYGVGKSLYEAEHVDLARQLLERHGDKLVLPLDFVVSEQREGGEIFTVDADKIPENMMGLDIGDKSTQLFLEHLSKASTIFWNGPLGVFEIPPFDHATREVAENLARMKKLIVIGGGDTAEAIDQFHLAEHFTHVSTGGGAAMELVAGHELPGIKALE